MQNFEVAEIQIISQLFQFWHIPLIFLKIFLQKEYHHWRFHNDNEIEWTCEITQKMRIYKPLIIMINTDHCLNVMVT